MAETIEQIASVHLGKTSDGKVSEPYKTPEAVDATLLVAIPRTLNRDQYGIKSGDFVGVDVFNAYEISFLSDEGRPVSAIGKIIYGAGTECIVESKSLKLYLNSFNMARFGSLREAEKLMEKHLSALLNTAVTVQLWLASDSYTRSYPIKNDGLYRVIDRPFESGDHDFTHFTETPDLLQDTGDAVAHVQRYHSASLRSNCRVTNQPDWGDVYIEIACKEEIDDTSLYEYIASFRNENHFHEEVCEVIFKRLKDRFNPSDLTVTCLYTRRGGIDINPSRSMSQKGLPEALLNPTTPLRKSNRQ